MQGRYSDGGVRAVVDVSKMDQSHLRLHACTIRCIRQLEFLVTVLYAVCVTDLVLVSNEGESRTTVIVYLRFVPNDPWRKDHLLRTKDHGVE